MRRVTEAGGVAGSPTWSADGKRVLFYETDETGAYLAKGGNSRTELVAVDVATGDAQTVHRVERSEALAAVAFREGRSVMSFRGSRRAAGLRDRGIRTGAW